jgi:hypothetical protein
MVIKMEINDVWFIFKFYKKYFGPCKTHIEMWLLRRSLMYKKISYFRAMFY